MDTSPSSLNDPSRDLGTEDHIVVRAGDADGLIGGGLYEDVAEDADGTLPIHHALGLLLVRKKQHGDSLPLLKKAADLGPENPHLSYVYGFALTSLRQVDEGLRVWTAAQTRHPNDRELLHALATTHFSKGDLTSARRYAKRLVDLAPRHQGFQALWSEISKPR